MQLSTKSVTNPSVQIMKTPNLFDHATKELSQDAMLCWLLSWAGVNGSKVLRTSSASGLRDTGIDFLKLLIPDLKSRSASSVEIQRQLKHIDILAVIDREHALVIEDKIWGIPQNNQLQNYQDCITEISNVGGLDRPPIPHNNVHFLYIKTGNLSLFEECAVENQGYRVIDRRAILNILENYSGRNAILLDFRAKLQQWEDETQSFRRWTNHDENEPLSLHGFFRYIEDHFLSKDNVSDWIPLGNLYGQGVGLWCEDYAAPEFQIWIEIKKISIRFKGARTKVSQNGMERGMNKWSQAFSDDSNDLLKRPKLFAPTRSKPMCVAEWRDWIAFKRNGTVDLPGSLDNIARARSIFQRTVSSKRN